MTKYDISIRYVGESVENGSIPVSELAPSLLGLSEALSAVKVELFPDNPDISLNIKATEKGSFIVDMSIVSNFIKGAIDFFNSDSINAYGNLSTIAAQFVMALDIIRQIHGKKVSQKKLDGDKVELEFDNKTINTTVNQINIIQNINFRDGVQKFAKPVKSHGINEIRFTEEKKIEIPIILKENVEVYDTPDIDKTELDTSVQEVFLNIVNVAFENGKWKFSNGTNTFFAKIMDEEFLKEVERNEIQFGSTDTLKVKLETRQSQDSDGKLHSEYAVLAVLEHRKGGKQLNLFN